MSLPYTRFFWSDWRAATGHLDLMERGAYMALLEFIYQHQKPLPGDMQRIFRLTHATSTTEQKAISDMLNEFFFKFDDPEHGFVWRHLRAEKEIDFSCGRHATASQKASRAARARWKNAPSNAPSMPEAMPEAMHKQCQPEPEPEPELEPYPEPEPEPKNTHVVLGNEKPQNPIADVERDAPDLCVSNPSQQKKTPEREIFDYWRSTMDHPRAKFVDKRKRCIKARMREGYSVADIKAAIDGCRSSDWHQGKNDRKTIFDDIELICRDSTKLDAFISKANSAAQGKAKVDDFLNGKFESALYPEPIGNTIEGEFHAI